MSQREKTLLSGFSGHVKAVVGAPERVDTYEIAGFVKRGEAGGVVIYD